MKRTFTTLAACLLIAGCSAPVKSTPTPTVTPEPRLAKAAMKCGYPGVARDGGKSVTVDTKGKGDTSGHPITLAACILGALEAPDYVISHIDATRALDGQQTDSWDGLTARWAYHPDDGLTLIIVDTQT